MRIVTLIAAIVITASVAAVAEGPSSWLDRARPAGWNTAGAAVPQAPPVRDDDGNLARCRATFRPPTLRVDAELAARGWIPFAPAQGFGETELVLAATAADGMCRPLGYQGFVFVGGKLAGTLAPAAMDARSEGALGEVHLRSADRLDATFARYDARDPLCCPSRTTTVGYRIDRTPDGPVLVPVEARTAPSPRP